jgi:hypothetical protein
MMSRLSCFKYISSRGNSSGLPGQKLPTRLTNVFASWYRRPNYNNKGRRNAIGGHSLGERSRAGRPLIYTVHLGWMGGLERRRRP